MAVFATAGATLHIGGAIAYVGVDLAESDFSGVSWVQIKEVESLGSVGETATEIDFTAVGDARQRRVKGSRSSGTMEIVCGLDYADAGQLAALVAEKTEDDYAFKVVFDDAPSGGTPSERYFAAIVGGVSEQFDTVNNVMKLNVSLWVNSNVVRVNAAESGS